MLKDFRGVPVSTGSRDAVALYETALAEFQRYSGDPIATIERALAADPDFIMGHLFKAFVLYTTSEQRYLPMVREAVTRAAGLHKYATQREQRLTLAAERLVAGDWLSACQVFDEVLIEHPCDALSIQISHLMDFYRGDAVNLRNRVARVLRAWRSDMPGYSYVLGMQAFGLEECHEYAEAERLGRRALEIDPADGWSVHAVAHVMEMQGRIEEGMDWLRGREADWAKPGNGFAPHNWWHLALFHLDRGEHAAVLEIVDQRILGPQTDMLLVLVDATAMLWRLSLEGVDIGDRFERVADIWQGKLDVERGHYAFNDLHAMLSFAACGRGHAIERLLAQMRETATGTTSLNAVMTSEVGLPLAEGMLAFARGQHAQAITRIARVRDHAHRFGGSNAQRDLLSLTLIEAAIRSRDLSRAEHYLAERARLKPTDWSWRLATRIAGARVQVAA
ncbi:tetratricopeptide repeat protein [Uliginosibacterium sp. H1]|uniref:tetratricopeptide repeat protein n=1 Tax=Uliginosibacterium sp. H1 TaxID=3114757 RepID=UPI002E182920|nr:tetratricopeptide repeat protein [Uliginosibacterium sp. H1]